jgi:hypothetical protein
MGDDMVAADGLLPILGEFGYLEGIRNIWGLYLETFEVSTEYI